MVRLYRASNSDMRKSLDRQPHVLKILGRHPGTQADGSSAAVTGRVLHRERECAYGRGEGFLLYNKAVVFLRLGFSAQDSKEPLVLPVDWPAAAPITRGAQLQGG